VDGNGGPRTGDGELFSGGGRVRQSERGGGVDVTHIGRRGEQVVGDSQTVNREITERVLEDGPTLSGPDRTLRGQARQEREARLLVQFYGAACAATAGEPQASLATCEKVPMPGGESGANRGAKQSGGLDDPASESENHAKESDTNTGRCPPTVTPQEAEKGKGTEFVESADDLHGISPGLEAIRASLSRDRERQRKVLALIQAGEVAHAKRLAMCNRQSVQLECAGCGSDENYVPVSCGSRLCEDCMNSRMGEKAHQYLPVVEQMEQPTHIRLSLPFRVESDPESVQHGVDGLRGAFNRLRRRVVPPSGDGWEWRDWKRYLRTFNYHDLARRWQKRYVEQGKGIPVKEILRSGVYGIDIKQQDDGRLYIHMHIIVDVPWIPRAALASLWDDVIDAQNVWIERIDSDGRKDEETALMEVVGYAAKAPEYESVEDEVAYLKALKGSKLLQPFGDLHGNTPPAPSELRCCTCERVPRHWRYLGVVDGYYETAVVHGGDVDRPPPKS